MVPPDMLGFQPYETFQLLIETGGVDRTNTLLIAINDPMNFVQYTFAEAVALVVAGVDLIRFAFDDTSQTGVQFYVNGFAIKVVTKIHDVHLYETLG